MFVEYDCLSQPVKLSVQKFVGRSTAPKTAKTVAPSLQLGWPLAELLAALPGWLVL
jgi:hypothetical protein